MRGTHLILIALTGLTTTAIAVAASHGSAKPSGDAIYAAHCANCHSGGFGGFFTRAPKVGKQKDWEALTPKGVDALTASTLAGVGKMAARGDCAACTDEEIRAAVEYMLEKSQ